MAGTTFGSHLPSDVNLRLLVVKPSKLPDISTVIYFPSVYDHFLLSFVCFSSYRCDCDASYSLAMAGNLTSPFQGLNPILPPRVATTLSREQFLYSLARTPSPARFQRPRSNGQILSRLDNPFQTRGTGYRAIDYPHDATSAHGFNLNGGPNSEPAGKDPVAQIHQNLGESSKRRNLMPNEATTNFQKPVPDAEFRSTLRAVQIPTPTSERNKTAAGIIPSEKSYNAPSLQPLITSVASIEHREYNTPFDLGDESGYER